MNHIVRTFGWVAVLALVACGGEAGGMSPEDEALLNAQFNSPQVCEPGQADPRACDPSDTKKTTICHLPPGNPANEHTLCVGNSAVPAHLAHGDHLGSCCGDATGGDDGGVVSGSGGDGAVAPGAPIQ